MFAFQQVIMPIANEFNPDLLIGKFITYNHTVEVPEAN